MPRDLHPALCRITDSYYQMFIDVPVMRDIWQATQADRALQKLDEEDGVYLAGLLGEALRRIAPDAPTTALASFSQLIMTLIAATVRHAITQNAEGSGAHSARCSSGCCRRIWPRWRCKEAFETYCSNTAAQAGLRLAFCRRRHAVIARAFGISPAQRR